MLADQKLLFTILVFIPPITIFDMAYIDQYQLEMVRLPTMKKLSRDLKCQWAKLKLLDPPGPKTGLGSKPGSGNTWARHLLQLATGIQTGAVYNDSTLRRSGFPGEGISNGSALCIKSHGLHE
jgi:hypothetical protein